MVTAQVNTSVFYNNGKTQVSGLSIGIKPDEADMMYSITSSMVEGKFETLKSDPNGIVIGIGIAEKMNLVLGDNINLTSQKGVTKNLRVAGIFDHLIQLPTTPNRTLIYTRPSNCSKKTMCM